MLVSPNPENELDVHQAKRRIEADDARVIDVRTRFRFPAMPGAEYVPLEDILVRPQEALPNDKPIIFICEVGQASGVATQMALAMGLTEVFNMRGGMEAWVEAGYETAEPPAHP